MAPQPHSRISVLCRFWHEDGVWNGKARDLAIVIFGATFEDAEQTMRDAIVGYLRAARKMGLLDEMLQKLQASERESLPINVIPVDSPLLRLQVSIDEHPHVVAG